MNDTFSMVGKQGKLPYNGRLPTHPSPFVFLQMLNVGPEKLDRQKVDTIPLSYWLTKSVYRCTVVPLYL